MGSRPLLHIVAGILSFVFLAGCTDKKSEKPAVDTREEPVVPKKPPSNFKDTLKVTGKAVVFYYPDSLQLEQIREILDPGDFESIMHEFEYLEKNARNILVQSFPDIPVLEAKNYRYILFNKEKKDSCVDLDRNGDPIGLYFFKPTKDPQLSDLPNVGRDLSVYFSGH
jgi:hypothetical protein